MLLTKSLRGTKNKKRKLKSAVARVAPWNALRAWTFADGTIATPSCVASMCKKNLVAVEFTADRKILTVVDTGSSCVEGGH
jgi:hypothetical protein